jgi:hypothetical protein
MGVVLLKILYWTAVLAVSVVLVVLLIRFFESRDQSQVENGSLGAPAARLSPSLAPARA